MGCAVAISEGPGNSLAVVADGASGSASAWSGYTGGAEALVEAGAAGSASATAKATGKAVARVAAKAGGNATVRSLGTGTAQAAVLAGGGVFLDNAGPGNIVVEHYGDGLIEVHFDAPSILKLINRYPGHVHCHFARDGQLLVRRGQASEQFSLSLSVKEVKVDAGGQVLVTKDVTHATHGDANVENSKERSGRLRNSSNL
jgi:hypothetical protein